MKNVTKIVMTAALLASGLALAGEVQLNCPAGTRQVESKALEATLCMKGAEAHGPYVRLHPNGKVAVQGEHQNHFRSGTWTFFDENGVKTEQIQFQRGDFHGRKLTFHENGRKALEENYVQGRRDGLVRKFDITGDVTEIREYRQNLMVKR